MHGITTSRRLRVTLALAATALAWSGTVAALATTVNIGERQFEAVAPQGFVETGVYHPEVKRLFESALPKGGRLVELYLPADDFNVLHSGGVPKLDRVYQLQVLTATENKLVSNEGFTEVAQFMEKGLAKPPAGMTFGGVRERVPWGLFYALQLADGGPAGNTEVGAAVVVINYQLLQLMYYVESKRPNARSEADEGVLAWARALRQANPDKQHLAERAGKLDLGSGSSAGRAAFEIGRILGLACFGYILYQIFRRRTN